MNGCTRTSRDRGIDRDLSTRLPDSARCTPAHPALSLHACNAPSHACATAKPTPRQRPRRHHRSYTYARPGWPEATHTSARPRPHCCDVAAPVQDLAQRAFLQIHPQLDLPGAPLCVDLCRGTPPCQCRVWAAPFSRTVMMQCTNACRRRCCRFVGTADRRIHWRRSCHWRCTCIGVRSVTSVPLKS